MKTRQMIIKVLPDLPNPFTAPQAAAIVRQRFGDDISSTVTAVLKTLARYGAVREEVVQRRNDGTPNRTRFWKHLESLPSVPPVEEK